MKNLKYLSLTLTILVLTTISMPIATQSSLIEDTCNKTPKPSLCLQFLKSDPRSSSAKDVKSIALIIVDVIKSKANNALHKIQQLLQGGGGQNKNALNSCGDKYKAILQGDVPQATQALKFGDPKFAEDAASDSSVEANSCERSFNGKSPLTSENSGVRDAADITRAIVRILL